MRSEWLDPPVAARIFAYSSLALYEGYAADRRSNLRSLAGQLNGLWSVPVAGVEAPVDGATVAAATQRVVLDSLFSEGLPSTRRAIDSLADAQIDARRRAGVRDELRNRSIQHGRAIGNAILAWAATDGFFATRGRTWRAPKATAKWDSTVTTDPNRSNAADPMSTLPHFDPVGPTEPYWGTLRTFALRNGDECAPPPPPAYSERRGSDFWKMGKEMFDSVSALTPEKKAIALFWADNPVATGTPGFHWMSVVNQMITLRALTAEVLIRLLGDNTEFTDPDSLPIADQGVDRYGRDLVHITMTPQAASDPPNSAGISPGPR